MDPATYDPTDGLNTNVKELVRCYVKCDSDPELAKSRIMLYSSRRLLSAQLYALNGYVLNDSPANFNNYQSYIAQALVRLPVILQEMCFKKYVVYHAIKAKLISLFGEAMFCILKPAVQTELMKVFNKKCVTEARHTPPPHHHFHHQHHHHHHTSAGKIFRFLNAYLQTDTHPPDWSHTAAGDAQSPPQTDGLSIGPPQPSRGRAEVLAPRQARTAVVSNYHAVKRQVIGRFGEPSFTAHKAHISDYLRRVAQFALPQSFDGISQLLHAKDGLLLLLELVSVKDILALSATSTLVHRLLNSEAVWEELCNRIFPAQSCATQLLQLCFHMTWREKFTMFNSRVLRRRIAAVVARPPPPKQLHHWMAIMPPLAAQEAASAAAAAATAEEAAGAAEFPNCAGTGGNEPFDLCLGLLGSPKAGVSSLLHCLSTNHDVKSVDAVPRYKSVLLTIQLRLDVRGSKAESDSTSASESDESPSHTTSAGYSSSPTGPRTLRVLFVDLGALVSPMKRIWFWRHANFTHIEHAATEECHNSGSEQAFHNIASMKGILFCYDLAETASFDAVHRFWNRMRGGGEQALPPQLCHSMFLGCKGDRYREVPRKDELHAIFRDHPLAGMHPPFQCETSARWNIGVQWAVRRFVHAVASFHGILGTAVEEQSSGQPLREQSDVVVGLNESL